MDLLKSTSFYAAGELSRSQWVDSAAPRHAIDHYLYDGDCDQKAVRSTSELASSIGSINTVAASEPGEHVADAAEALIMLNAWHGHPPGYRSLTPAEPVPTLEQGVPAIDARNLMLGYVFAAFE